MSGNTNDASGIPDLLSSRVGESLHAVKVNGTSDFRAIDVEIKRGVLG